MKTVKNNEVKKMFQFINNSKSILITGHIRPDGDVIGSALALFLGIKKKFRNKTIDVFFEDSPPTQLNFLPKFYKIKFDSKKLKKVYDLCIMLECSEINRAGCCINLSKFKFIVNIDHHFINNINNFNFNLTRMVNIIYPEYSSCAEIVFSIFNTAKIKLDKKIALCLYTGLVTDTGMFQWSNTNIHSFSTAAKLLSYQIQPYIVYKNIYKRKTYNSLVLLSKVLSTLELQDIKNCKIANISLTQKMLKDTNTTLQDTEDFINFPMSIDGVKLAIFFKEEKRNLIKISFRSDGINVEKLARKFSGGGHKSAAGATIAGSLKTVKHIVFDCLSKVL
ncbi:MAG: bifunctional oligoribonuclease/PAP phosphatase NrnA [Endomicrobia bacterium]|nr:bifunctional oligoribonuclease/PAP phosphatase NrnA [Endomicrobiia bacterium]